MPWESAHPASRRFRNSSLSFRKCRLRGSWVGNYFGRSHQKAALKYWVWCGWGGKGSLYSEIDIFFKGGKTGESNWTEAQCGLCVASHEPGAHFPCWKKGRSVSIRSLTEQGNCRQQLLSQAQAAFCGTWQIITQLPWCPSWGTVDLSSDPDPNPKCRDILEQGVWKKSRWLGNLGVWLPTSREDAEQVGWQKMRRMGMIKCFKLCLIFYRSHGEHCRSSRVAEKLKANRMFVTF